VSTPATSGDATETPKTDAVLKIASIEDRYLPLLELSRQLERELTQVRKRLNWAANELLACDYGDNPENRGVGWSVFGWRDVNGIHSVVPYDKVRRIYGASIDQAIDAELAGKP